MKTAGDSLIAKKRIQRFFATPKPERKHVADVINDLAEFARVYIFGGAARDISLHGGPYFTSDVDLVVHVGNREKYLNYLKSKDAQINKFGGYRFNVGRWNFDVWEANATWAISQGIIKYKTPISLLETTFFNWDAIIYDVKNNSIYCKDSYFSEINKKILEINLPENPNSYGVFVRTLRLISLLESISTGPNLTKFILSKLETTPDHSILEYEKSSFHRRRLSNEFMARLRLRATTIDTSYPTKWFSPKQLELF